MQTRYETIDDVVEAIETREDFERFLRLLINDYRQHMRAWENADLSAFLSGLEGFTRDMEGYFTSTDIDSEQPSWKLFATMLLAARVYE